MDRLCLRLLRDQQHCLGELGRESAPRRLQARAQEGSWSRRQGGRRQTNKKASRKVRPGRRAGTSGAPSPHPQGIAQPPRSPAHAQPRPAGSTRRRLIPTPLGARFLIRFRFSVFGNLELGPLRLRKSTFRKRMKTVQRVSVVCGSPRVLCNLAVRGRESGGPGGSRHPQPGPKSR